MAHKSVLDSFRLDGKVALVTGGSRGLGRTMATALAQAGADVAITARTLGRPAKRRRPRLPRRPGAAAEASRPRSRRIADVERLADDVEAAFGQIDILVNNAGHQYPRSGRSAVGGGLGFGDRHQSEGPVPVRPRDRSAHGQAWLGPRDQHGIDAVGDRAARPRAVRIVQGRRDEPVPRAGARVGGHRRHREHDLSGSVRHRDEPPAARRSRSNTRR